MSDDLDRLLARMRGNGVSGLAGVEDALWREIGRRRARDRIMAAIGRNTGIAAAGLVIGLVLAVTRPVSPPKPVSISLLLTEVPPASLLE